MERLSTAGVRRLPTPDELRAQRRAARQAVNRSDILDAAERTFAQRGLNEGSIRDIAKQSGFSTAAIYNYFENKQHLLAETLSRRGRVLLEVINGAASTDDAPLEKLHRIVDGTVEFFETYPDFRRILAHARESEVIVATALAEYPMEGVTFPESLGLMTRVIEEGQALGEIREGPPGALIHLYMALVNEHVFLAGLTDGRGALTNEQFHELLDDAFRRHRSRAELGSTGNQRGPRQ